MVFSEYTKLKESMKLKFIFIPAFFVLFLAVSATSWFAFKPSRMQRMDYSNEIAMETYEDRQFQKRPHPNARDYNAPMTEQEQRDIRFIIISLATKSHLSLLFERRALNRAGDRVAHVHPLKFLSFIFSDDELKNAVTKIRGIPWRRFSKDMGASLGKSANRRNLKEEYLADYIQTVGVNEELMTTSIENGRWEDFINVTRSNLP